MEIINKQLPITNYQLLITNHQLPKSKGRRSCRPFTKIRVTLVIMFFYLFLAGILIGFNIPFVLGKTSTCVTISTTDSNKIESIIDLGLCQFR